MGGGNSLNIIRVPSVNEAKNIIFNSDLNGNITSGSNLVWNYNLVSNFSWLQNNNTIMAHATGVNYQGIIVHDRSLNKENDIYRGDPYNFRPIIEYRE